MSDATTKDSRSNFNFIFLIIMLVSALLMMTWAWIGSPSEALRHEWFLHAGRMQVIVGVTGAIIWGMSGTKPHIRETHTWKIAFTSTFMIIGNGLACILWA